MGVLNIWDLPRPPARSCRSDLQRHYHPDPPTLIIPGQDGERSGRQPGYRRGPRLIEAVGPLKSSRTLTRIGSGGSAQRERVNIIRIALIAPQEKDRQQLREQMFSYAVRWKVAVVTDCFDCLEEFAMAAAERWIPISLPPRRRAPVEGGGGAAAHPRRGGDPLGLSGGGQALRVRC